MQSGRAKKRARCRLITEADLGAVADLLCAGFRGRARSSWEAGLERMRTRDVPAGAPRYGYCLDADGTLVGVILLVASLRLVDGRAAPFSNVASWYVVPEYRAYAQFLVSIALRDKQTTYTNVSPAPHTWTIVESQGYSRYCNGLFFAAAAIASPAPDVTIATLDTITHESEFRKMPDYAMLRRHHAMGCKVLVAIEKDRLTGFVLQRYRIRSGKIVLPAMQLIHGPDRPQLVRLAGNLGRHLLRYGAPFLIMDADGPVDGLRGIYTEMRGRKYFKGPHRPALCDLADSEFAIFGI